MQRELRMLRTGAGLAADADDVRGDGLAAVLAHGLPGGGAPLRPLGAPEAFKNLKWRNKWS